MLNGLLYLDISGNELKSISHADKGARESQFE